MKIKIKDKIEYDCLRWYRDYPGEEMEVEKFVVKAPGGKTGLVDIEHCEIVEETENGKG